MREAGVTRCMLAAMNASVSDSVAEFVQHHDGAYGSAGFHPNCASSFDAARDIPHLRRLLGMEKMCAVGEIGLDFYRELAKREVQEDVCKQQLMLADELCLPVIYHVRSAHPEMIALLKKHRAHLHGGVIHCFSAGWAEAQQYLELGMHISCSASILHENASDLREVVRKVPAERLLIETDSPYLPPPGAASRRNEPCNVRLVAEEAARLRGETAEAIARQTTENALRLFRIS